MVCHFLRYVNCFGTNPQSEFVIVWVNAISVMLCFRVSFYSDPLRENEESLQQTKFTRNGQMNFSCAWCYKGVVVPPSSQGK